MHPFSDQIPAPLDQPLEVAGREFSRCKTDARIVANAVKQPGRAPPVVAGRANVLNVRHDQNEIVREAEDALYRADPGAIMRFTVLCRREGRNSFAWRQRDIRGPIQSQPPPKLQDALSRRRFKEKSHIGREMDSIGWDLQLFDQVSARTALAHRDQRGALEN